MFRSLNNAKRLLFLHILRNKDVVRKMKTSSVMQSSVEPMFVYRRNRFPPPAWVERMCDVAGIATWYWIIYHCITQSEHITGEWEYPKPSNWTDEELGIPPDDVE